MATAELAYYNRRNYRPGIYGTMLDGAHGRELDRRCAVFGVRRERRGWWILSWNESDESLRRRTFLSYIKAT